MILLSNLHKVIEKGIFAIAFVKEDGSIVKIQEAVCTSWHSKGRIFRIKIISSGEIRSIRRCTVISYNDQEVCL
jgi:hypothetical protein